MDRVLEKTFVKEDMEIPTDGRDAEQIKLDRGTTSQLLGQLLFMRKRNNSRMSG